jgi:hypothetical protein
MRRGSATPLLRSNPGGRVVYSAPFSVLEWAEGKRKRRERGGNVYLSD